MIKKFISYSLVLVLVGCAGVQQHSSEFRTVTSSGGMKIERKNQESVSAPMSARNVEPVVADAGVQGAQLGIVYFGFDEYIVEIAYLPLLERVARILKDEPNLKVTLEGHTDAEGSTEYNLALGQRRAEAVRQRLAILGVTRQQAEALSFGEEKPASQGRSKDIDAQNRRAEIWTRP